MKNCLEMILNGCYSRIASDNIIELDSDEIFVFGSNESGRHGKGAAKLALNFGAKYGKSFGLQGNTYAIPTVNASITSPLSIAEISHYVDIFLTEVKIHQHKKFLVTKIGCGLAGLTEEQIAPMFKHAISAPNVYLPTSFIRIIWNM